MQISSRTALATTAAALLLASGLAGCTATSTTDSPSAASQADAATSQLDPFSEYLSPDPALDAARQKQTEQAIQSCMKDEGFAYTIPPDVPNGSDKALTREWVEENGTGNVELQLEIAANGGDDKTLGTKDAATKELSASEANAYDAALYGKAGTVTDQAELDALTWKDHGCAGKAAHEVYPNDMKTQPPIIDDAQQFLSSLAQSPEITTITDDYKSCMSDAGYTVTMEGEDSFIEGGEGVDGDGTTIVDYLKSHPNATAKDPAVVKFKEAEIDQALSDWDCRQDVDYYKRYNAALAGPAKKYIAEHKGELEEAKLWLNQ